MPFPSDPTKASKISSKKYAEELLGELQTPALAGVQKIYAKPDFAFSDGESPLLFVGPLDPKWKPLFVKPAIVPIGTCIYTNGVLTIEWKKNDKLFKTIHATAVKNAVKAIKGFEVAYGPVVGEPKVTGDDDDAPSSGTPEVEVAKKIETEAELSPKGKAYYKELNELLTKLEGAPAADKVLANPKMRDTIQAAMKRAEELYALIEEEAAKGGGM